ncbi:hypothetical protein [Eggerthia catenaformis]|uniref:hypothetical protein n=1 Tax=Eggerthia catenaformis TaxID=31973 RepID=UPI00248EB62F|nr:hypothetical protein [Eggerthia catenaformis]
MFDFVENFIRSMLWGLVKMLLWAIDFIWDVILKIATLDLFTLGDVSLWFSLISLTMIMFITYKVFKIIVKFYTSDDYRARINILSVILKIGLTTLVISLAPVGMKYFNDVAIKMIDNVNLFLPTETKDNKISHVLTKSGVLMQTEEDKKNYNDYVHNTDYSRDIPSNAYNILPKDVKQKLKPSIQYDDYTLIDINAKYSNGKYIFFPDFSSLFLMIGVAGIGIYSFISLAFLITKRTILIMMQYLLAPYAVASIIDPEDRTFGNWSSTIGGNLLMNFAQIYGTYFVLSLANNTTIAKALGDSAGAIASRIVLVIGGFMAVASLPQFIGRITGGETAGLNEAMSEARGVIASGGMVKSGIAGAAGFGLGMAAGTIAGAGSGAKKGFSKGNAFLKSNGIKSFALGLGGGALGLAAGAAGGAFKPGWTGIHRGKFMRTFSKFSGFGQNSTKSDQHNNFNNPSDGGSYNDPPTESQLSLAEKLNIQNADKMTKGELSQAIEKAGGDKSFWDDNPNEQATTSEQVKNNHSGHNQQEKMFQDRKNRK